MRASTFLRQSAWITGLLAISGYAAAATVTLSPLADSYVYDNLPNQNDGTNVLLASGTSFPATQNWWTYLKFGLGSIPAGQTITSATLHLYQVNGGGFVPVGTNLSQVANDDWLESTLTWNNQPVGSQYPFSFGPLLAYNADGFSHVGWSQWDLLQTGNWDYGADLADGLLSLVITESSSATQTHNWCSRESDLANCLAIGETGPASESRRPYLEITYVPLPGTALLLATGLAAAGWRRRRA